MVIWIVHCFKSYIIDMLFIVITNHSALWAICNKEELAGVMQLYSKKLSTFDYDIQN